MAQIAGQNSKREAGGADGAQTIIEEKVVRFNGDISIKKYIRGKFLGKGGFAKCYDFT